jgi:hypothetical protein
MDINRILNLGNFPVNPAPNRHTGPVVAHGNTRVVNINAFLLRNSSGEPMVGIDSAAGRPAIRLAVHLTDISKDHLMANAAEWHILKTNVNARVAARVRVDLDSGAANLELSPGIDGNPLFYPIDTNRFSAQFPQFPRGGAPSFANFIAQYVAVQVPVPQTRNLQMPTQQSLAQRSTQPSSGAIRTSRPSTRRTGPYSTTTTGATSTRGIRFRTAITPDDPSAKSGKKSDKGKNAVAVQESSTSAATKTMKFIPGTTTPETSFKMNGNKGYMLFSEPSGNLKLLFDEALNSPDYKYFLDTHGGTGLYTHYVYSRGKLQRGQRFSTQEIQDHLKKGTLPPGHFFNEKNRHRFIYFSELAENAHLKGEANPINAVLYESLSQLLVLYHNVSRELPTGMSTTALRDHVGQGLIDYEIQFTEQHKMESVEREIVKRIRDSGLLSTMSPAEFKEMANTAIDALLDSQEKLLNDDEKAPVLLKKLMDWENRPVYSSLHNRAFSEAFKHFVLTRIGECWKDEEPEKSPKNAAMYILAQNNVSLGGTAVEFRKPEKVYKNGYPISSTPGVPKNQMINGVKIQEEGRAKLQVTSTIRFIADTNDAVANIFANTHVTNENGWEIAKKAGKHHLVAVDPMYYGADGKEITKNRTTYKSALMDSSDYTEKGYLRHVVYYLSTPWERGARLILTNRYSEYVKDALTKLGMEVYGPTKANKSSMNTSTKLVELIAVNFNLDGVASVRQLNRPGPEHPLSVQPSSTLTSTSTLTLTSTSTSTSTSTYGVAGSSTGQDTEIMDAQDDYNYYN